MLILTGEEWIARVELRENTSEAPHIDGATTQTVVLVCRYRLARRGSLLVVVTEMGFYLITTNQYFGQVDDPILFEDIVLLQLSDTRADLFSEEDVNSSSQHFIATLNDDTKIDFHTIEEHTKIWWHMYQAWHALLQRRNLSIAVAVSTRHNKQETRRLYFSIEEDILASNPLESVDTRTTHNPT